MPKVALFNMPFAPATRPSLQTGLLKSWLAQAGIEATCFYPNITLYDRMRQLGCHQHYGPHIPSLWYEWYFSPRDLDWRGLQRLQAYSRLYGFAWDEMLAFKKEVISAYLEDLLKVDYSGFDLFAFTMTYPQINASLAMASRLRESYPGRPILFGGAGSQIHNESAHELLRVFPFLDCGLVGEAEPVLIPLVEALLDGRPPRSVEGAHFRWRGQLEVGAGIPQKADLNAPIYPDYDEYFEMVRGLDRRTRVAMEAVLPIEMGRGCAWGDEMTCKFCAFTFHGAFQRRSKERIWGEVDHQIRRYFQSSDGSRPLAGRQPSFYVVDDLVTAPMISEVFPRLRELHPNLTIPFMEVRTTLTEKHLDQLAQAGVKLLQPGTESMEDGLLKLMSKGTTTFHNLMFLKGCAQRGIRVSHNLILGFPGATAEQLERQLRHLRLIPHLDPPAVLELQFVRFSPYFAERHQLELGEWKADDFYGSLYPPELDVEKIAYEYRVQHVPTPALAALYQETLSWVNHWRDLWQRPNPPYLRYLDLQQTVRVVDGRGAREQLYEWEGEEAELVRSIQSKPLSAERAAQVCGLSVPCAERFLKQLCASGLVLEIGGRYLGLAVLASAPLTAGNLEAGRGSSADGSALSAGS